MRKKEIRLRPALRAIAYCRKINLELEAKRLEIDILKIQTYEPAEGRAGKSSENKGDIVDGLIEAVNAHRAGEAPEDVSKKIEPVSDGILLLAKQLLRGDSGSWDVHVSAHQQGGKVTCEFILYHCERRGNTSVWEEEDKWKAKVTQELDTQVRYFAAVRMPRLKRFKNSTN